jgi:predicted RNA-binding protein YlqC (UPF0109 family)
VKALLEFVARGLVEDTAAVELELVPADTADVYRLRVAPSDVGKVIGKHGRTAHAIRLLLAAGAARIGRRVVLEIEEDGATDGRSAGALGEAGRTAR